MSENTAPDYWFYHLEGSTIEGVLPNLLEKTLAKGWRALVKLPQDKLPALDDHLWTFREDSFLAHGRDDEPMADWQPVLLSSEIDTAEGFDVVFLLDGMDVKNTGGASRILVMINGRSEQDVQRERARWKALKSTEAKLAYYQQNDRGAWEKRA
jgi:DNA polymerase-3 subunit chi